MLLNDVTLYEKERVAKAFGRAAQSYTQHNELQQRCARKLMTQLPSQINSVLDAGCGPGVNTEALSTRSQFYLGLDLSVDMLEQAESLYSHVPWLHADIESLPLAAQSFEVIYANLALQWMNDLTMALKECHRVLSPQGELHFSTILAGSMNPLGNCLAELHGHRHHNEFLEYEELIASIEAQSCWHINARWETLEVGYDQVLDMLHDLKGIGANYVASQDTQKPLTRELLKNLELRMESYRQIDGKLPLYWSVAFIKLTKKQSTLSIS